MKITITLEDLKSKDPIKTAIKRQHGLDCSVDRKWISFYGNERFPRRLPLIAEDFQYKIHTNQPVEPFSFEL